MGDVYDFGHDFGRPPREMMDVLGGKGAGLAEMTSVLGLPVPPGFTIGVQSCREYRSSGWPEPLSAAIDAACTRLAGLMGRSLGDVDDPLVVSVRSGAPRSMPGMLDTILNLGLNDDTVRGLAKTAGDDRFAWDIYARFVASFATSVLGIPTAALDRTGTPPIGVPELKAEVRRLKQRIAEVTGAPMIEEPADQLRMAVKAVWRSWDSERARAYRVHDKIDEDLGTAVSIQAMVFGNRGMDSGTGVVFTRNPATGDPQPYGDFLTCAQGEDVVAGTGYPQPITALAEAMPGVWQSLSTILRRLEVHYSDICDVEFTVEQGRLWILQTRIGKRSSEAAVRSAVAMVYDRDIRLPVAEALSRLSPEILERARHSAIEGARAAVERRVTPVAIGLGASPGRVSGIAVFNAQEADDCASDFILVRTETSPEDVPIMSQATGILTCSGGLVSHAAVVARGWGLPAVVGMERLIIADSEARVAGTDVIIGAGDQITIDGTTGELWLGSLQPTREEIVDEARAIDRFIPELALVAAWQRGQ